MSFDESSISGRSVRPNIAVLDPQALEARTIMSAARDRVNDMWGNDPDVGYFPASTVFRKGSVLRGVQERRSVGLNYGQIALATGALDTLNFVGTSEHTKKKEVPFQRLAGTARIFETIFFGSREEADAEVNRVFLMHTRVRGETTEAVGHHPLGTPYSAFDPERSLWTMACLADAAISLHETLVHPLSTDDREAFWQDYLLFGELFGLARDKAPPTYPEFQQYIKNRLTSGELHLTRAAQYMGEQACFHTPIPHFPKPLRGVMNLVLRGMLRQEVREMYGIPYNNLHQEAFQATASAIRRGNRSLPTKITTGNNRHFFDLVIQEEKRLQCLGKQAVMRPNPYN